MKVISSKDNPLFKQFKQLADSARERRKAGQTVLDGPHLLAASLEAGLVPEYVVCSAEGLLNSEICNLLEKVPTERRVELTTRLFNEISPVETPSGVLAVIAIPRIKTPEALEFCLFLEDVQDPGNLGAIFRSAAAAGVQQVYLSMGCGDAWSPKALRGGMGAHFAMAIEERVNLPERLAGFKGMTIAASLQAGKSLYDIDLSGPVAFMAGNEGAGLSAEILALASHHVTIPMPGRMESLNVATAVAVCLFERVRQRGFR